MHTLCASQCASIKVYLVLFTLHFWKWWIRPRTSKHTRMGPSSMLWMWMGKDTESSCFALFHSVSKEELALLSQNLYGLLMTQPKHNLPIWWIQPQTQHYSIHRKLLKCNVFGREENVAIVKGVNYVCQFKTCEVYTSFNCVAKKIRGLSRLFHNTSSILYLENLTI